MKKIVLLASVWLLTWAQGAVAQEWKVMPDASQVTFTVRNAGIPVDGTLEGLQAVLVWDPARPVVARLSGSVQTRTLDTGIGLRNKHLKGKEYFDVERFPEIRFASQSVSVREDHFVAVGTLTLKQVSRQVEIPFAFREADGVGTFEGTLEINRLDYGVGHNSWTLSDQVKIIIRLKAQKVSSSQP